ncbi:hypothetical protein [Arthrobacter sp. H20]|uniref:hypothetical protein n=1 Tax=Arthrobacter sp. H20 TaxID=1267981 RepID=UPI00047E038E|nr:hypothetical protein [Arthrobacter sp. H20]
MNLLDQLQQTDAGSHQTEKEAGRQPAVCSRKACRLPAAWQLLWNNPKLHTPDRRKVWVACGEHRDWLEDYLQTRGLWKETLPLDSPATEDTDTVPVESA